MHFCKPCVSRMHHLGMRWNATRMQQLWNVVDQECTWMQHGAECNRCRMQHVQNAVRIHRNAAYTECNRPRMHSNANECITSICTQNAPTEMQREYSNRKRMQRVRNASEFYIMLQILNASRTKCNTNVPECIVNARMHQNSYGQKEHAFRAEIARLPVTLLGVAVRSPIQKKALP